MEQISRFKQSGTTLQVLGKTLSYSVISTDTHNYDANAAVPNPSKTFRNILHYKGLNLTPLFTPTWFSDAFIALFGYPSYKREIYISTVNFKRAIVILIIKIWNHFQNLQSSTNLSVLSSFEATLVIILISGMVIDLNDAHPNNLTLPSTKTSHQTLLSTITEDPSDEASLNYTKTSFHKTAKNDTLRIFSQNINPLL